jgi:hypothetical protein
MVAKIMCLSIAWYHVGIALGWEPALKRIEERIQAFIWRRGIPKVAKATLKLPKKEGSLSVWSLMDKARAFTSMWVVKFLQNNTNLYCKIPSRRLLTGMQFPKGPRSCYGNPGWFTYRI